MNEQKSGRILDWSLSERTYRVRGGVKVVHFSQGQGSYWLELRGLT